MLKCLGGTYSSTVSQCGRKESMPAISWCASFRIPPKIELCIVSADLFFTAHWTPSNRYSSNRQGYQISGKHATPTLHYNVDTHNIPRLLFVPTMPCIHLLAFTFTCIQCYCDWKSQNVYSAAGSLPISSPPTLLTTLLCPILLLTFSLNHGYW